MMNPVMYQTAHSLTYGHQSAQIQTHTQEDLTETTTPSADCIQIMGMYLTMSACSDVIVAP